MGETFEPSFVGDAMRFFSRLVLLLGFAANLACPANSKADEAPPAGPNFVIVTPHLIKRTTIGLSPMDDSNFEDNKDGIDFLTKMYADATNARRATGRPMIPPAVPMVSGSLFIYADDKGISAVCLKDTPLPDPKDLPIKANELFWHNEKNYSPLQQVRDHGPRTMTSQFLKASPGSVNDMLFHRTQSATFTIRNGQVHFADDLAILPPDEMFKLPGRRSATFGVLLDQIIENGAKTVEISNGKTVVGTFLQDAFDRKKLFGENLFLGPPLSTDKDWLLIRDSGGKLRLTHIAWEQLKIDKIENAKADWDTELLTAPMPVSADPHRRLHAIHLVEAENLILCPTHLGRIVGMEAKTGKIAWTHEYAPVTAKRFETFAPEWVVVPPVVAGDRCVYAPADFPELLCLETATGRKIWGEKKGTGLYPAVVGERVLVIGEKGIRALSLKDGKEQWAADLPGLPCGRGAVHGDFYLVPVSEPKTWRGMIAVVNLKTGKVAQVIQPDKDEPIGNLVVHQEFLISQTLTEIAVFSLRKND